MSNQEVNEKIREAIVAGIFYADDPVLLQNAVDSALAAVTLERMDAVAILTPHAGFEYAGSVQAMAWKSASKRRIERVVIIAPRHRARSTKMYLPESHYFQTPLGDILVDSEICDEIESCGTIFETNDIPHLEEHSIEVQLPFMRRLFPEATLIPIIVDGNEIAAIMTVARAMDLVLGPEKESTLFVVSSNLASSTIESDAAKQADGLLDMICQGDWHALIESSERNTSTACGGNAIAELMSSTMISGTEVAILGRSDSRLQDGDSADRIVHYAAAAWYPGG